MLVSVQRSVREVPRSIPSDITSLCQYLSFLCSSNGSFKHFKNGALMERGG